MVHKVLNWTCKWSYDFKCVYRKIAKPIGVNFGFAHTGFATFFNPPIAGSMTSFLLQWKQLGTPHKLRAN